MKQEYIDYDCLKKMENEAEILYSIKYDANVLKYNPDFLERDVTKDKVLDYIREYA